MQKPRINDLHVPSLSRSITSAQKHDIDTKFPPHGQSFSSDAERSPEKPIQHPVIFAPAPATDAPGLVPPVAQVQCVLS